jgi:hypothetical protein
MTHHALSAFVLLLGSSVGVDGELPWPKNANPRINVEADGTLRVEGDKRRTQTHLLTIERPTVPSHQYRLVGKIKFQDVEGEGYVELLNRFPGRGEFFSRTLAEGGAMGKLTGSSDWRDLELPFMSEPGLLPDRLTINLVLPGQGQVWLTPLRIDTLPDLEPAAAPVSAGWFVLGPFAVAVILVGSLAAIRRTRRVALWVCRGFAVASLASVATGAAIWHRTPHMAPFLLFAGLTGLVTFSAGAILLRKSLGRDELRRMRAMDVAVE